MEQTECFKILAFKLKTPVNYSEGSIQQCHAHQRNHHYPILQQLLTSWGCTAACILKQIVGDVDWHMWNRNHFLLENSCTEFGIFCIQFLNHLVVYLQWNRLKSVCDRKFVICRCEALHLSAGNFYKYFLKNLALCMWRKGFQRPEIMRTACTIFSSVILEFVVDRVAVGWDLLWVVLFCVVICYLLWVLLFCVVICFLFWVMLFCVVICYCTNPTPSVHWYPSYAGQILTELVH
jgi:hypothetical protein